MPATDAEDPGPIFLAGADRSGIGLLGEILECHPDVSLTRRTNYWSQWFGRYGDLRDPSNLTRMLDAMGTSRRLADFAPDRAYLATALAKSGSEYQDLFALLQTQLMERRGATRWGDKSLGAEQYAATIFAAYPTARMAHVLRDPRDRFASHKHHRGPTRGGVGAGAAMWRQSERLAMTNTSAFGDKYLIVRYEDLVDRPNETLETVADHLGLEPAAPAMLPTSNPLTTTSIGRHISDISEDDRRFLELACRAGMARHDYAVSTGSVRPKPTGHTSQPRLGGVRFWVIGLPLRTISALRWRVANHFRHNRHTNPRASGSSRAAGSRQG